MYEVRVSLDSRFTWGLQHTLESFDDKRGGGGDDVDFGLSILNGELNSYTETLPRAGCFRNIFTDLLR